MTTEDEKLICDYMGWTYHVTDDGKWWNCIGPKGGNHLLDSNDASLVVAEMQKRGEWTDYRLLAVAMWMNTKSDCEDITAWLFNADNFFNAFVQWRKTK